MPRDLFGDVSDPRVRVGSRKWYTVPLSLFVHTLVLLLVIVIPLVATGHIAGSAKRDQLRARGPGADPACRRRSVASRR